MTHFAHSLARAMELEQLTQDDVAELAHVSRSTVSRWLSEQLTPSLEEILRLRDARRMGHPFNAICANMTLSGQRPDTHELAELDADGDGRVTVQDVRLLNAQVRVQVAHSEEDLEMALQDGRIDAREATHLEMNEARADKMRRCMRRARDMIVR